LKSMHHVTTSKTIGASDENALTHTSFLKRKAAFITAEISMNHHCAQIL
jgi:hypothetical protein